MFESKQSLFRAAVKQALERDLIAVARELADADRPLRERLIEAFDRWAGVYIGPLTGDLGGAIGDHPGLLGTIAETASCQFEGLIAAAIATAKPDQEAVLIARTMISASIGIKHQAVSRDTYLAGFAIAVDLLLR